MLSLRKEKREDAMQKKRRDGLGQQEIDERVFDQSDSTQMTQEQRTTQKVRFFRFSFPFNGRFSWIVLFFFSLLFVLFFRFGSDFWCVCGCASQLRLETGTKGNEVGRINRVGRSVGRLLLVVLLFHEPRRTDENC